MHGSEFIDRNSLQILDAPAIDLQRHRYLYTKIRPHVETTEACDVDGEVMLARDITTPLPEDVPLGMLVNSADN